MEEKMQENWYNLLSLSPALPYSQDPVTLFVLPESCLLSYGWLERNAHLLKLGIQNFPTRNLELGPVSAGFLKDMQIVGIWGDRLLACSQRN